MRHVRVAAEFAIAFVLCTLLSMPAHAIDVSTPPEQLPDSPLLITAYGLGGATGETPGFIEIYNSSSGIVKLNDWRITMQWQLTTSAPASSMPLDPLDVAFVQKADSQDPDTYLKPKQFTVVGFNGSVPSARINIDGVVGNQATYISSIGLRSASYQPFETSFSGPTIGNWFLGETTTGFTSTGSYYEHPSSKIRSVLTLYDGGLYQLGVDAPRSFPLAPVEVLANPRTCAPDEVDTSCREYVKFYNDTDMPIDFAGTSLRIGTLTSSSSVPLGGVIQPGEFVVFAQSADGGELSITNSGGYVWLSDEHGVQNYPNTLTAYDDASSTAHKGQSWALIGGVWQWSVPNPFGANQPLPVEEVTVTVNNTLTPCRADQYRNPETNRCKLIASTTTSLAPCAANQYRNPETNRCKSIATSTSSLAPCKAGQYRNPETNRCKSILAASSSLTPCRDGYERNPDTNRCRKVALATIPATSDPVETVASAEGSMAGWAAFAVVASLAAGYGIWEWRAELAGVFSRIRGMMKI